MVRSRSSRSSSVAALAAGAILLGSAAVAQELGDGVQLHGFASQAAVWSSDNRVGGHSDSGVGLDMRELGANLSWRPDPDWLLSAQALARWAGKADEGDARLDYAFVDRSWRVGEATRLGARLGKVKNPYGFFNTTRDVAHTRPGVIMPQSIYMDQIRNFFLAAPGVTLYGETDAAGGSLSWQLGALRPEVDDVDLEYMFFLNDLPGRFKGTDSWLGQVLFEPDGGRWRLGLTMGEMNMRYRPGRPPPFDLLAGNHELPTWVLSLEHNSENWTFTGEYAQTENRARDYGVQFDNDNTVEAWYLQATRRLGPDWRAYLRYDVLYLDRDDRNGAQFAIFAGMPGHTRFARDSVLGVRYDVGGFAFWAEYHRVDGTAWLARVDNPVGAKLKRDWDMLLLQAAWYF